MIIPDINLLLYAHIQAFDHHDRARAWWEGLLNGGAEVGIPGPSIFGFLRLATNPRVFRPPMAIDVAVSSAEAWLSRPQVHFLLPGPRHLAIAFHLLREAGTGANLTTDVQLAAYAIEHQGEVHSNDTDFGRFSSLRWVNPLD